ncbi:PilZ domain-containing protein [Thalassotalea euphylliae]|uniref:PilZ domain-containing protein n=1 Tax=Thalassotalea euphylliae TaxID=1655234 RepID=A0A3E0UB54_9GAMM|nr:PilZ domain-containing protein [Thalassotalea euphylliae]REL33944.1 PilZ domain-containing protein [Thalassotalea euphylliae]
MTDSSNHEMERRQSIRLDMEKELVTVSWSDSDGRQWTKTLACLDFSRGGVRVDSDMAIAENTQVVITFKSNSSAQQEFDCTVLRCIEQPTGWYEVAFTLDDKK